ncbi:hypothetical protein [Allosphingosinicella humi]
MAKITVLCGGAILLGWMVVKTSIVLAVARTNPAAARGLAASDPRIAMSLAMREFAANKFAVNAATQRAVVRALGSAPLAEEPFLLGGAQALNMRQGGKAKLLLEEARRRNPRSRATRLFLLDYYLRANEVPEAAEEIAVLTRIVPEVNQLLIPTLALLAHDPKFVGTLRHVLDKDSTLRQAVLLQLATTGVEPDVILKIAGAGTSSEDQLWQSKMLDSLVVKGEIRRAHSLWAYFLGEKLPAGLGIYDPQFERRRGALPFNWSFLGSGSGVAEPTKSKSLDVQYYGRDNADLARQLLVLTPGQYRFTFRAAGDTPQAGSGLAWEIKCSNAEVPLVQIGLRKVSYAGQSFAGNFVVPPSGCAGQWLTLSGTAREFPTSEAVTISGLGLTRIGNP